MHNKFGSITFACLLPYSFIFCYWHTFFTSAPSTTFAICYGGAVKNHPPSHPHTSPNMLCEFERKRRKLSGRPIMLLLLLFLRFSFLFCSTLCLLLCSHLFDASICYQHLCWLFGESLCRRRCPFFFSVAPVKNSLMCDSTFQGWFFHCYICCVPFDFIIYRHFCVSGVFVCHEWVTQNVLR